jgi:flagellar biosynthesis anti-sigma factor FlgM
MKINRPLDVGAGGKAVSSQAPGRAEGAGKGGAAPTGKSSGDSVHISDLSAQLHALESTLATGAEFDRTRVEAIKKAIADGQLAIHPEVIADRMLASEMGLLTGKGGKS